MIALDPIYSIGIAEIDAQHARWFQIIDEFKAVAGSEEQLLAAHGYPGPEAHKRSSTGNWWPQ